jgi:hypothetical protein
VTVREMLVFAGGVLGPALVAQQVADLLRAVPGAERARPEPRPRDGADALLRQVFPDGLTS